MTKQHLGNTMNYVLITPVRDEEAYIEKTINSMLLQTIIPLNWVIVNDGSTDATPQIIEAAARSHPWIEVAHYTNRGFRKPGGGVIEAFNYGYATIKTMNWDFIVKLDGDLSFKSDYFEELLCKFQFDKTLGIASGVYIEQDNKGVWRQVAMPKYHAAGASKMIRKRCFHEIGGFVTAPGWDTVDEIRAISKGWKTKNFPDLVVKHHKSEGSGVGTLKTSRMHGEIFYLTGGSKLFFLLKVIHRTKTKPILLGALALLYGYLSAYLKKKVLLVTPKEARCYRALLNNRIMNHVKILLGRR